MQYDMTALKIFKWWLTKEIDNYEDAQFKKVDENKLDITIDSPSLRRYLFNKFRDITGFTVRYGTVRLVTET